MSSMICLSFCCDLHNFHQLEIVNPRGKVINQNFHVRMKQRIIRKPLSVSINVNSVSNSLLLLSPGDYRVNIISLVINIDDFCAQNLKPDYLSLIGCNYHTVSL